MIPQVLLDTLAVLALFFVRIGLPFGILLAFGYWLRRKLRPQDFAESEPAPAKPSRWQKITLQIQTLPDWLPIMVLLMAIGAFAAFWRLGVGLGAATNLNQAYPWGLWIGFDLFLVAFSGGAFTLATLVYVFNMHQFHPAVRPTVLTGLLGYSAVLIILVMDLGRWDRFYHFLIYPNINSALFEVSWCIFLYSIVLFSEFSPVVLERWGRSRALSFVKRITIPLAIGGATLSTMHQSSLGTLFVIMTERVHPLWYTAIIPLLFFISSVAAGLAVVVAGGTVSYWVFKRSLSQDLVGELGRFIPWILGVYVIIKLGEIAFVGELGLIFTSGIYSVLFNAEMVIGVLIPIVLFSLKFVRQSRTWSLAAAITVLLGIFLNRFDAAWFALKPMPGYTYFPSLVEIAIQAGVLAAIVFVYTLIGHYFPLFEGTLRREEEPQAVLQPQPQHAY